MISRILDINEILQQSLSSFLFGARGTGKTVLAKKWLETEDNPLVIDLLDPEYYQRYLVKPEQLKLDITESLKNRDNVLTVFIDEVQKVPALLDVVHKMYTEYEGKIRFLLSGSSARKLKRGGADLMAGRLITLNLFPFCFSEYQQPINDYLLFGSLPVVTANPQAAPRILRAYVNTYLKEEVLEESLVRKIDVFTKFLELAGQYHGKIINYSSLADVLKISSHSVKSYFQILEDTLVGFSIPGWSASTKKQLRIAPKFYLFDNGVATTLRGELHLELSEQSTRYGELFEAIVIQEIQRLNEYRQLDLKFSYWQTNSGHEVDLIISRGFGQPLAAIEIKSSTSVDAKKLKGLNSFAKEYPEVPRYCFCQTPLPYTEGNISILPWEQGLQELGEL
ncbi:MAG: ATP-binding protein [Planctomycetota bacterium]|jgi:predicted AAA+ superfamily ATPase